MFIPALFAKLLSAGAIAQAATGAGVAVVVVTGAGAAGVLPAPVQDTVASVVETVTPFDLPSGDEASDEQPEAEQPVVEQPEGEQPEGEQPVDDVVTDPAAFDPAAWAVEGPQAGETFGQWVSEGAHNKALLGEDVRFGEVVSTWAHKKHLDAAELENEGVDLDELTDDTTTEPAPQVVPATDGDQQVATTDGDSKGKAGVDGSGHGNSAGKGKASVSGNGGGKGSSKGNGHN